MHLRPSLPNMEAYVASLTKLQYTCACTSVPPHLSLRFLADLTVNNGTAMLLNSALVLCSSSLDFWHVCSKRFIQRRAVDLKVPRCCIRLFQCKITSTRLFRHSFCHFYATLFFFIRNYFIRKRASILVKT